MTAPAVEAEVDPDCTRAVEEAAKLLASLGHEVDDESPFDALGDDGGVDIQDSFLTRWAAGQAALLAQIGMIVGKELSADDVEPLTWALAEVGRERSSGLYLADVAVHHGVTRMIAGWFASGHDLLLSPTMAEVAPPLGSFDDSGDDPMQAFTRAFPSGGVHGALQRHRPAGDLPAPALDRRRRPGRGSARRSLRPRGPAAPGRRAGRARRALGGADPTGLRRGVVGLEP